MLLLYDRETSGNAYKVRLLLSLLNVPYERITVTLKDGKNQVDPDYRDMNPRGQIPTLVHGEFSRDGISDKPALSRICDGSTGDAYRPE